MVTIRLNFRSDPVLGTLQSPKQVPIHPRESYPQSMEVDVPSKDTGTGTQSHYRSFRCLGDGRYLSPSTLRDPTMPEKRLGTSGP